MTNKTNIDRSPEAYICPRCGGLIPSNDRWGEYPGAISRLTRAEDEESIEICSDCGTEEALIDFSGGFIESSAEYPLMTESAVARRFDAIAIIERHKEKMASFAFRERIKKNHTKD